MKKTLTVIALLFTTNLYAADNCVSESPCRVEVVKNDKVKYSAKFDTTEIAKGWATENETILHGKRYRNSFGRVRRWLREDLGDSVDTRIVTIESEVEGKPDTVYTEYKYPKTYKINYIDLTAKINEENLMIQTEKDDIIAIRALLKDIEDPAAKRAIRKLFKKIYGD